METTIVTFLVLMSHACLQASSSITIVNGPQNVTAAVGSNVIFPCESDQGSTLLPLWKINGIPYTLTSLPSWHWFGSDGLHVDRITADTNNTKYVCYFVINNEVAVESKPAFLLVITPRINGDAVQTTTIGLQQELLSSTHKVHRMAFSTALATSSIYIENGTIPSQMHSMKVTTFLTTLVTTENGSSSIIASQMYSVHTTSTHFTGTRSVTVIPASSMRPRRSSITTKQLTLYIGAACSVAIIFGTLVFSVVLVVKRLCAVAKTKEQTGARQDPVYDTVFEPSNPSARQESQDHVYDAVSEPSQPGGIYSSYSLHRSHHSYNAREVQHTTSIHPKMVLLLQQEMTPHDIGCGLQFMDCTILHCYTLLQILN